MLTGKSTLLRLLIGRETPEEGIAKIVGTNVISSYFEQNQADALDLDKTVIETIQAASTGQSYNELRALLGQFLFKGDDVEKKVRFLSGGEKARLSLCCMLLEPANFLVLGTSSIFYACQFWCPFHMAARNLTHFFFPLEPCYIHRRTYQSLGLGIYYRV